MKDYYNTHRLWFKAISIGLMCLFLVNNISYAAEFEAISKNAHTLVPTSRFNPIVTGSDIRKVSANLQKIEILENNQEFAAFLYLSVLVGRIMASFDLAISADGLKGYIKKQFPNTRFNQLKLEEMYEEDGTFCLPYVREDGKKIIFRYHLPEYKPLKASSGVSMPLGIENVNIICEGLEDASYKETEEGDLTYEQVDIRPANAGLLHLAYIKHDMAVKELVNPDNKPLKAIYGGAGADVSNFLLSTNAEEAYFIANYDNMSVGDLERCFNNPPKYIQKYFNQAYSDKKFTNGFGLSRTLTSTEEIISAIAFELAAIGVRPDSVTVGSFEGYPRIQFKWGYKGCEKKQRTITLIDADVVYPMTYKKALKTRTFDLYYQRAGVNIATDYGKKKENFIAYINEHIKPGGYFITDDHVVGYERADDHSDRAKEFPLDIPVVKTPDIEKAASQILYMKLNLSRDIFYGWDVRVRQKYTWSNEKVYTFELPHITENERLLLRRMTIDAFLKDMEKDIGHKAARIKQTFDELVFNVMEHGMGGIVKVHVRRDKLGNILNIRITSRDNGSGLKRNIDELIKRSLRAPGNYRRGFGFQYIALNPDRAEIEYNGKKWARIEKDTNAENWFAYEERSSISKGMRFTLEFDISPPSKEEQTFNYFGEIKEDSARIISAIFKALDVHGEDAASRQEKSFYINKLPLAKLNKDTVLSVFDLPETTHLQGSLSIIRYNSIPVFLCLEDDSSPRKILDLTPYYLFEDPEILKSASRKAQEELPYLSRYEKVKNRTSYVYPVIGWKKIPTRMEIPEADSIHAALENAGEKGIPVLPGVFHGVHPSSEISIKATDKFAKPGKKVLIIGTGTGIEAWIAAQKGAIVHAVDSKEMAVENTKLTCILKGTRENVFAFQNNLFEDLGEYDLIIFNMPHISVDTKQTDYITLGDRNVKDFDGKLLKRAAKTIESHIAPGGKAVLINSESTVIEKVLREETNLHVSTDFFQTAGLSQGYIISKPSRPGDAAKKMPKGSPYSIFEMLRKVKKAVSAEELAAATGLSQKHTIQRDLKALTYLGLINKQSKRLGALYQAIHLALPDYKILQPILQRLGAKPSKEEIRNALALWFVEFTAKRIEEITLEVKSMAAFLEEWNEHKIRLAVERNRNEIKRVFRGIQNKYLKDKDLMRAAEDVMGNHLFAMTFIGEGVDIAKETIILAEEDIRLLRYLFINKQLDGLFLNWRWWKDFMPQREKAFSNMRDEYYNDSSPYKMLKLLREIKKPSTAEGIRLKTEGRMDDGHLSQGMVIQDLNTLIQLGLAEKRESGRETIYKAKKLTPLEWKRVSPILKEISPLTTSGEIEKAKKDIHKRLTEGPDSAQENAKKEEFSGAQSYAMLLADGYEVVLQEDFDEELFSQRISAQIFAENGKEDLDAKVSFIVSDKYKTIIIEKFLPRLPIERKGRGRALLKWLLSRREYAGYHVICDASEMFQKSFLEMSEYQPMADFGKGPLVFQEIGQRIANEFDKIGQLSPLERYLREKWCSAKLHGTVPEGISSLSREEDEVLAMALARKIKQDKPPAPKKRTFTGEWKKVIKGIEFDYKRIVKGASTYSEEAVPRLLSTIEDIKVLKICRKLINEYIEKVGDPLWYTGNTLPALLSKTGNSLTGLESLDKVFKKLSLEIKRTGSDPHYYAAKVFPQLLNKAKNVQEVIQGIEKLIKSLDINSGKVLTLLGKEQRKVSTARLTTSINPVFEVQIPNAPNRRKRSLVFNRIENFGLKTKALEEGRRKALTYTLYEVALNIMEHGEGGTIKVYHLKNERNRISGLKIIAVDNGKGIPHEPNKLARKSIEATKSSRARRGFGFKRITFSPDKVIFESKGKIWDRVSKNVDKDPWFKKDGKSEVTRGTKVTLEFYKKESPVKKKLPDGSPYKIFEILLKEKRFVLPEVIRLKTKGRMSDGHLSIETIERDLETLKSLNLVVSQLTQEGWKYSAMVTSARTLKTIKPVLESLGARPFSYEIGEAKRRIRQRQMIDNFLRKNPTCTLIKNFNENCEYERLLRKGFFCVHKLRYTGPNITLPNGAKLKKGSYYVVKDVADDADDHGDNFDLFMLPQAATLSAINPKNTDSYLPQLIGIADAGSRHPFESEAVLVFEYIDGANFHNYVRRLRMQPRQMRDTIFLELAEKILKGYKEAYLSKGYVHGDLDPTAIMVTGTEEKLERVVFVDNDTVTALDEEGEASLIRKTATKDAYASLDRMKRFNEYVFVNGMKDLCLPRDDVYSLCATLLMGIDILTSPLSRDMKTIKKQKKQKKKKKQPGKSKLSHEAKQLKNILLDIKKLSRMKSEDRKTVLEKISDEFSGKKDEGESLLNRLINETEALKISIKKKSAKKYKKIISPEELEPEEMPEGKEPTQGIEAYKGLLSEGYRVELHREFDEALGAKRVKVEIFSKEGWKNLHASVSFLVIDEFETIIIENLYPNFPEERKGRGRALLRYLLSRPEYSGYSVIASALVTFQQSFLKMEEYGPMANIEEAPSVWERVSRQLLEKLGSSYYVNKFANKGALYELLSDALTFTQIYGTVPFESDRTNAANKNDSSGFIKQGEESWKEFQAQLGEMRKNNTASEYGERIIALLKKALETEGLSSDEKKIISSKIEKLKTCSIHGFLSKIKGPEDFILDWYNLEENELFLASDIISELQNHGPPLTDEYLLHAVLCPSLGHYEAIRAAQKIFSENYPDKEKLFRQDAAKPYKGLLGKALRDIINWEAAEVSQAEESDLDAALRVHNKAWAKNPFLKMDKEQMLKLIKKNSVYLLKIKGVPNPVRAVLLTHRLYTGGDLTWIKEHSLWRDMLEGRRSEECCDTLLFWAVGTERDEATKEMNLGQLMIHKAGAYFEDVPYMSTFSPVSGFTEFKKKLLEKGEKEELIQKYGLQLYLASSKQGGYKPYLEYILNNKFVTPEEFFQGELFPEHEETARLMDPVENFHMNKNGACIAKILPCIEGFTRPDAPFTVMYGYKGFKSDQEAFKRLLPAAEAILKVDRDPAADDVIQDIISEQERRLHLLSRTIDERLASLGAAVCAESSGYKEEELEYFRSLTAEPIDNSDELLSALKERINFKDASFNQVITNIGILHVLSELPKEQIKEPLLVKIAEVLNYTGSGEEALKSAAKHFLNSIPDELVFEALEEEKKLKMSEEEKERYKNELLDIQKQYIEDLKKLPRVTRIGEITLGTLARLGDESAKKSLIEANLRLSFSIALKFNEWCSSIPLLDLVNEGNAGLMEAAGKWEPERGLKFSTHATWWIRQAIGRYIQNNSTGIRIPVHLQDKLQAFKTKCTEKIIDPTDPYITSSEIAKTIDMSLEEVEESRETIQLRQAFSEMRSVEYASEDDPSLKNIAYKTVKKDPEFQRKAMFKVIADKTVERLVKRFRSPEKRIEVFTIRILPILKQDKDEIKTLEETGKIIGLSKERVSKLQQNIMPVLKSVLFNLHLKLEDLLVPGEDLGLDEEGESEAGGEPSPNGSPHAVFKYMRKVQRKELTSAVFTAEEVAKAVQRAKGTVQKDLRALEAAGLIFSERVSDGGNKWHLAYELNSQRWLTKKDKMPQVLEVLRAYGHRINKEDYPLLKARINKALGEPASKSLYDMYKFIIRLQEEAYLEESQWLSAEDIAIKLSRWPSEDRLLEKEAKQVLETLAYLGFIEKRTYDGSDLYRAKDVSAPSSEINPETILKDLGKDPTPEVLEKAREKLQAHQSSTLATQKPGEIPLIRDFGSNFRFKRVIQKENFVIRKYEYIGEDTVLSNGAKLTKGKHYTIKDVLSLRANNTFSEILLPQVKVLSEINPENTNEHLPCLIGTVITRGMVRFASDEAPLFEFIEGRGLEEYIEGLAFQSKDKREAAFMDFAVKLLKGYKETYSDKGYVHGDIDSTGIMATAEDEKVKRVVFVDNDTVCKLDDNGDSAWSRKTCYKEYFSSKDRLNRLKNDDTPTSELCLTRDDVYSLCVTLEQLAKIMLLQAARADLSGETSARPEGAVKKLLSLLEEYKELSGQKTCGKGLLLELIERINNLIAEEKNSPSPDGFIRQGAHILKEFLINLDSIKQNDITDTYKNRIIQLLDRVDLTQIGIPESKQLELEDQLERLKNNKIKIYGFTSMIKGPDDFFMGWGDEMNDGVFLATDVIEELESRGPPSLVDEYLLHEIICPHLGHYESIVIQQTLFPDNYPDKKALNTQRNFTPYKGLLGTALRSIIDQRLSADSTTLSGVAYRHRDQAEDLTVLESITITKEELESSLNRKGLNEKTHKAIKLLEVLNAENPAEIITFNPDISPVVPRGFFGRAKLSEFLLTEMVKNIEEYVSTKQPEVDFYFKIEKVKRKNGAVGIRITALDYGTGMVVPDIFEQKKIRRQFIDKLSTTEEVRGIFLRGLKNLGRIEGIIVEGASRGKGVRYYHDSSSNHGDLFESDPRETKVSVTIFPHEKQKNVIKPVTEEEQIEESLSNLIKSVDSDGNPLSLIVLQVNDWEDKYANRPDMQNRIAEEIQSILKKHIPVLPEAAFQYGGNGRFYLMLPALDAQLSFNLANLIKEEVASSPLKDAPYYLTLVMAIGVYPDSCENAKDLLKTTVLETAWMTTGDVPPGNKIQFVKSKEQLKHEYRMTGSLSKAPVDPIKGIIEIDRLVKEQIKEKGDEKIYMRIFGNSLTAKSSLARFFQECGIGGLDPSEIAWIITDDLHDVGIRSLEDERVSASIEGKKLVIIEGVYSYLYIPGHGRSSADIEIMTRSDNRLRAKRAIGRDGNYDRFNTVDSLWSWQRYYDGRDAVINTDIFSEIETLDSLWKQYKPDVSDPLLSERIDTFIARSRGQRILNRLAEKVIKNDHKVVIQYLRRYTTSSSEMFYVTLEAIRRIFEDWCRGIKEESAVKNVVGFFELMLRLGFEDVAEAIKEGITRIVERANRINVGGEEAMDLGNWLKLSDDIEKLQERREGTFSTHVIGAKSGEKQQVWIEPTSADETLDFINGEYAGMFRWFTHFMKENDRWKQVGEKYKVLRVYSAEGVPEGLCVYEMDEKAKYGMGLGMRIEILEVAWHNTERAGEGRKLRGIGKRLLEAVIKDSMNKGYRGRIFIEPRAREGFFIDIGMRNKKIQDEMGERTWYYFAPKDIGKFLKLIDKNFKDLQKKLAASKPFNLISKENLKDGSVLKISEFPSGVVKEFMEFLSSNMKEFPGLGRVVLFAGTSRSCLLNRTPGTIDIVLEINGKEEPSECLMDLAKAIIKEGRGDLKEEDIKEDLFKKGVLHFKGFPVNCVGYMEKDGNVKDISGDPFIPNLSISRIGIQVVGEEAKVIDIHNAISDLRKGKARFVGRKVGEKEEINLERIDEDFYISFIEALQLIETYEIQIDPQAAKDIQKFMYSLKVDKKLLENRHFIDKVKNKVTFIFRFSEDHQDVLELLEELGFDAVLRQFKIDPYNFMIAERKLLLDSKAEAPVLPIPQTKKAQETEEMPFYAPRGRDFGEGAWEEFKANIRQIRQNNITEAYKERIINLFKDILDKKIFSNADDIKQLEKHLERLKDYKIYAFESIIKGEDDFMLGWNHERRKRLFLATDIITELENHGPPALVDEYLFHTILRTSSGQYPAILAGQRIFTNNYPDKQKLILQDFSNPYRGRTGEALRSLINRRSADILKDAEPAPKPENSPEALNLWEDAKVIEMMKDLEESGLENFTKVPEEKMPQPILKSRSRTCLAVYKHQTTGLEVVQKYTENLDKVIDFFRVKSPGCCPTFVLENDAEHVYELNLAPLEYVNLEELTDNDPNNLTKGMKTALRRAISRSFIRGNEIFIHGHLRERNIQVKLDNKGNFEDIKIIDWKLLEKAKTPEDFKDYTEGKRKDLKGAILANSDMAGVDFEGFDLTGTNFKNTDLSWGNFKNAKLKDAILSQTGLVLIDLSGADLTNADMRASNLSDADLSGANLTNADLREADLIDTDITGAIMLNTKFSLSKAKGFKEKGYYIAYEKDYCKVTSPELVRPEELASKSIKFEEKTLTYKTIEFDKSYKSLELCTEEGETVAYIYAQKSEEESEEFADEVGLRGIEIKPQYRKNALAKHLMERFLDEFSFITLLHSTVMNPVLIYTAQEYFGFEPVCTDRDKEVYIKRESGENKKSKIWIPSKELRTQYEFGPKEAMKEDFEVLGAEPEDIDDFNKIYFETAYRRPGLSKEAGTSRAELEKISESAQSFVDSIIIRAIEAKKENKKLIIGIDTSWIPDVQLSAIQGLLNRLSRLSQEKGMDNIIIKRSKGVRLAGVLIDEIDKENAQPSNTIILGSCKVLESDAFSGFRTLDGSGKSAFFAKVTIPEEFPETGYVALLDMLSAAIRLAFGESAASLDNPFVDILEERARTFSFIPKIIPDAERIGLIELKKAYDSQAQFITAA